MPPLDPAEALSRLADLLADPAEEDAAARFLTFTEEMPGGTFAAIDALGSSRDEAAGRILTAVAASAPDKEHRKAARRALHKLESAGIAVERPLTVAPEPRTPVGAAEPARPILAYVTPADGVGSRILWLLLERPHGGLSMFNLALNDIVGLKDIVYEETTRRRFERRIQDWNERTDHPAIELPVEYGLSLLSEALELNAESGFPLPREFVIRRGQLGELPPPPTDALIHQHISRGQAFLMPNLVEQSGELLHSEPELEAWAFAYKEVEPFAKPYLQATQSSRLIVTRESPEQRQERIVDEAVDALLTPVMRRAFRRRLEEAAYVFWKTDRERAARLAVAAAFAITETGPLRSHPLLRDIVLRSIELAVQVDESGLGPPPGANRTAYDPI